MNTALCCSPELEMLIYAGIDGIFFVSHSFITSVKRQMSFELEYVN